MKLKMWVGVVVLLLVWMQIPLLAYAAWTIKDFKVVKKHPNPITRIQLTHTHMFEGKDAYIKQKKVYDQQQKDLANAPSITNKMVLQIEDWLGKVAREYEQMGFMEPKYTDIDSSNKAFNVYLFHFSGGAQAGMLLPCQNSGKLYMIVDSKRNFNKGKLTVKAHQDLAHELFHAVQGGYPIFNIPGCPGFWIVEGAAEAVGIEMARKLNTPNLNPNHFCQMGIRPYSEGIYVRTRNIVDKLCGEPRAYQTQSFWQFLGEYATRNLLQMPLNQWDWVEPDFRYLHDFFNITMPMGSQSEEFLWLVSALNSASTSTIKTKKSHYWFSNKLLPVYSRFVGAFSSYWDPNTKRRALYPSSKSGNTKISWLTNIFDKCETVQVKKVAPASAQQANFKFWPVSARCIEIKFVGFNALADIPLTFSLTSNNTGVQSDEFGVSQYGGTKVVRGKRKNIKTGLIGRFSKNLVNTGTPQYFIISYVPTNLTGTQQISVAIEVASTSISSSTAPNFVP